MGLLFGLILLWTRSLWVTVLVHSLYDISATFSWYYVDYAVEMVAFAVLIVHSVLLTLEKIKQNRTLDQIKTPEGVQVSD